MKKLSKAERIAYWSIDASNRIYESLHASSTVVLKLRGTICLDHCAAERQNISNNDFGQKHPSIVTRRKWRNEQVDKPIEFFHLLPEELQRTAVLKSKDNSYVNKRRFGNALENQFVKRWRKEDIALEKKYEDATEDYIVMGLFS